MTILITGATGFIGKKVLIELLKIYEPEDIIALSSKKLDVKTILHKNYEFYIDSKDANSVETLLHIGAFTPKNSNEANLIIENTSNIINTGKLIYKFPNLKKIVFASTLDVYKNASIINENTETSPISLYGWSKLYCEKMIETFAKKNRLTCQILRLGHVFGEGEEKYQKILPLTIKKVLNNETIEIWGDGEAIRTFIYIDDVAKAIVNAIKLDESELINIVGEEQVTINELVKKIIKLSEKNINIKYVYPETKNRNLVFDNKKLKEKLLKNLTSFDEGLKREYLYMRNC